MKARILIFIATTAIFISCKSSQQKTETNDSVSYESILNEKEETNEPVEPKYESPKNKSLDSIKAKMSTNLPKKE
ncbi:hypothetical protein GN157_08360 [Flavobacterium rakeshii]|uniref:Lipoprotein n=1 Tax=Flavobacterium rakeshii TaxID=1038845 RepID=A0A6N8HCS9_9FLAO|nr:hypothetical protein [Flavobacterium rakeshii]MEE1896748.1 hypothetical protein [Flavobacterium rakeshii]MUV03720.1 hypothetical protein [Flavobacterium rakeshii]